MIVKRILFILLSALLIAFSVFSIGGEEALIKASEETVAKYGGLYIDGDGSIISLYAYHGREAFLKNLNEITDLGDCGLPVYLAIPPMKMDVMELPEDIDVTPYRELFSLAEEECQRNGVGYIDLLSVMAGDGLYFSTDHHWTSRGAYLAYREIAAAMGWTPADEESFRIETAHEKYRGSDWGKSDKAEEYTVYDTIDLYYSEDYGDYVTTIVSHPYDTDENNRVIGGMYSMEKLESWDPYTVYFEGNTPYITVRNGEERETLMIVRDSFASALAPFLALHCDIVMIDPRFYPERLSKAVEREDVSAILVLENMGSFTENNIKIKY